MGDKTATEQKFISSGEAAKRAGVSANYIRQEIHRKRIPAFRDQRGWYYISEDAMAAFLERRKAKFEPV